MASLNRVFLIGNLTRDPEVRYIPSGEAIATLRLAVSRKYKTKTGEERDDTCFLNVEVWGRQGQTCGEYLSKGSPVFVEGRLKLDEWEKDGQKHSRLGVVAERVQFLGSRRSGAGGGGGGGGAPGGGAEFADAREDAAPARPAPAAAAPPEGAAAGDDETRTQRDERRERFREKALAVFGWSQRDRSARL